MTDIKKFKRGNRTYTRVGKFREVRVEPEGTPSGKAGPPGAPTPPQGSPGGPEAPAQKQAIQMDIDPRTEMGFYSNTALVHRSSEEVLIDFSFIAPNSPRGRILSRVILSPQHARVLSALLKQASEEEK